jgi:hypothetical protein
MSRLLHDHCARCRTTAPERRTERIPALENFILGWCRENGYQPRWETNKAQTKTTIHLSERTEEVS